MNNHIDARHGISRTSDTPRLRPHSLERTLLPPCVLAAAHANAARRARGAARWRPDWVHVDDAHAWEESGTWFGPCGVCLLDSPATASRDEATGWVSATRDRSDR